MCNLCQVILLIMCVICCRFTVDDFVEGMYRTVATSGTQYELVFVDRYHHQYSPEHRFTPPPPPPGPGGTSNQSSNHHQYQTESQAPSQYRTVTLLRPFAPLTVVTKEQHAPKQLVSLMRKYCSYGLGIRRTLLYVFLEHSDFCLLVFRST